jgi:hypothetical protein
VNYSASLNYVVAINRCRNRVWPFHAPNLTQCPNCVWSFQMLLWASRIIAARCFGYSLLCETHIRDEGGNAASRNRRPVLPPFAHGAPPPCTLMQWQVSYFCNWCSDTSWLESGAVKHSRFQGADFKEKNIQFILSKMRKPRSPCPGKIFNLFLAKYSIYS